ncbi:MAG: thermonuclease family protein [Sedimentisphaerales bacterium]|nr:thermonuclease family protein [Sedimentisphaerales bacterium]
MARYAMSGRRRNIIAAFCALAVMAMCVLDHSCTSRAINGPAQTAESQNSLDIQKYHGRQFSVVKVVDGDTLDIDIPDANYSHTRIRLWGVDTPETKDPRTGPMYFGKEASEFATKLAFGKQVTIYLEKGYGTRREDPNARDKDPNTRDKYHRLLAYVQLPDGTFLNEVLLSEGYAYADLRFKHGLYNKYKQLESAARSQRKGLWANVTFEQMPKWRQKRQSITAEHAEAAEVNN